jgi:uncharacterized membrane protein (DUF373 family)
MTGQTVVEHAWLPTGSARLPNDSTAPTGEGVADEAEARHWPRRRRVHRGTPRAMRPLVWAEDLLHYAVALVLVAAAGVALVHSVGAALLHSTSFQTQVPELVDSVLFVIIVLEIFTTVLAHFRDGRLQLQPFLVIGVISAVREILVVGARSSLSGSQHDSLFLQHMISLGVDLMIALLLVVALVLVKRFDIKKEH